MAVREFDSMGRMLARVGLALLGCTMSAVTTAAQFRAGTDVVRVPVIVTGRSGVPVLGLTRDDFELREDGRPQEVAFFAEGAPGESLPLHLGLLLDTSGSMEQDLGDAMTASIQFVNAVDESVDATLVQFDSIISVSRFTPASYPILFERIRERKADGQTALYDAAAVYLEEAMRRDGQHVLIMYTDGGDSSSTITFSQVLDLVRAIGNVIIYPIGYLEHQRSTDRLQQQMRLTRVAEESGGRAFFPGTPKALAAIYGEILEELRARYTLGYVPSDSADGRFRKLQVRVIRPGLQGAKARARSGYFAPRR